MKNVLVTGANGFIGRWLCKELVLRGYNVTAAVRNSAGFENELVTGDIGSFKSWPKTLDKTDVLIHLAGRAHVLSDRSSDQLSKFRKENTESTINLAMKAAASGVKRFIFLSSIGVNGNLTKDKPFKAEDTCRPTSPYAISKIEAEHGLKKLSKETELEVVIIRPPLVYGPNAPGNFAVMKRFIERGIPLPLAAVKDNKRSFVGIDNLIDLIITCIIAPAASNRTFLVSDAEDLSTAAFLRRVGDAMDKPARLFHIPTSLLLFSARTLGRMDLAHKLLDDLQIDITSTCQILDWTPSICVAEGLRRAFNGSRKF